MPYIIMQEFCPHCQSWQNVKFGLKATCLNCKNIISYVSDEEEDDDE
ncbi:UNVERIFIED_ORG: hypothetical protein Xoosp15_11 [Xanthomonas phage Xoo-sp15]